MKNTKMNKKYSHQEVRTAVLLLLPSGILLLSIAFYPFFSVVYTSFTDKLFASSREVKFIGLDNYKRLLSITIKELPKINGEYADPIDILPREPIRYKPLKEFNLFSKRYIIGASDANFIRSVIDTIVFSAISVFLELLLGILIAVILNNKFKGRGFMRMAMLLPWAIPTSVSSKIWEWMFASSRIGFFNTLFSKLGFGDGQYAFLIENSTQLLVMVVIDVWKTTPFMALLILAGLQLIPSNTYEAARIDGASRWQQFRYITLPLLKPTIMVASIFRILDAMRVFDLFQIIFGNKRYSMASFTYFELVQNKAMGYSSASSVIIFIILLVFTILYLKLFKGDQNE